MSGFSAAWLTLREPYDRAARNGPLLDSVAAAFAGIPAVAVTDLGCGTGSTLRAVAPRLPARQSWRLVDNDKALLAEVLQDEPANGMPAAACVTTVAADLAHAIDGAFDGVLGDCDLVTTSALLDLVSEDWLGSLVAALARRPCSFYAALSYDGVVALSPQSRLDGKVIAAVNHHQRTDKGFGPALGPDAARIAPERLRAAGFTVVEGRSDWQFGPDDRAIQMAMLSGWAGAAREVETDPVIVAKWLAERQHCIDTGRSQMRIGHVDVFATPTGCR